MLEIIDDKSETFKNHKTSDNDKGYTREVRFTVYLEQKTELNNVDSKWKGNDDTKEKLNGKKDEGEDVDKTAKDTSKNEAKNQSEIIANLKSGVNP